MLEEENDTAWPHLSSCISSFTKQTNKQKKEKNQRIYMPAFTELMCCNNHWVNRKAYHLKYHAEEQTKVFHIAFSLLCRAQRRQLIQNRGESLSPYAQKQKFWHSFFCLSICINPDWFQLALLSLAKTSVFWRQVKHKVDNLSNANATNKNAKDDLCAVCQSRLCILRTYGSPFPPVKKALWYVIIMS